MIELDLALASPQIGYSSNEDTSNRCLAMFVFDHEAGEEENPSTRRKTSRRRVENHQSTQPTCKAESGNWGTLVGDECSHPALSFSAVTL